MKIQITLFVCVCYSHPCNRKYRVVSSSQCTIYLFLSFSFNAFVFFFLISKLTHFLSIFTVYGQTIFTISLSIFSIFVHLKTWNRFFFCFPRLLFCFTFHIQLIDFCSFAKTNKTMQPNTKHRENKMKFFRTKKKKNVICLRKHNNLLRFFF